MNQYILTTLRMRRFALVIVGMAALIALLAPTATFAASWADVGSAEFVTVKHHKDYGKDYGKKQYHEPKHKSNHCPYVYTVQKGNTLSVLATHYKTTVHALARANGIKNPHRIYTGQKLCVPHGTPYVAPKPPKHKDSHQYCKASYTVKHKDSLTSIAKRYHTTPHKLISDNKLHGPHYIYSGQTLCIR